MGSGDKLAIGRMSNQFKQDYVLNLGPGSGAGGPATAATDGRYAFWIDDDPFATLVRRLITYNSSFRVWADAGLTTDLHPQILVDQSNDAPDEYITANGFFPIPTDPTHPFIPPYYITTNFLTQPADKNYTNDQGRYVYSGYGGSGLGIAKLGVNDGLVQSFVPTSEFLTAVWLKDIFHIGSNTDHTLFSSLLVFEIWDQNGVFVASLGGINGQFGGDPNHLEGNVLSGGSQQVTAGTVFYNTADDGHVYWTELQEVHIIPFEPIKLVPGQKYYIQATQTGTGNVYFYGIGSNTNNAGVYPGNGKRYIYGQAYLSLFNSGAQTWSVGSAVGPNISMCFVTQRNQGRTAINFKWGTQGVPSGYWYDPATFPGQFQFVKQDFDKVRI